MIDTPDPWKRVISPKVRVFYGFKDGHARLEVTAPIGIVVPVKLNPAQISKIKETFDEAYRWAQKPEDERRAGKGDQERLLDPRGKVVFGFPDAHVVIAVRIVVGISPWLPLDVHRDELVDGKKVMDEIYQWTLLPEEVREMQGVL